MQAMGAARGSCEGMFERRADPYEGADLATSRRVAAALSAERPALARLPAAGARRRRQLAGAAGCRRRADRAGARGRVVIVLRRPSSTTCWWSPTRGHRDRRAQLAGRRRLLGLRGPLRTLGRRRRRAPAAPGARPPRRDAGRPGPAARVRGDGSEAVRDMVAEALILVVLGAILTATSLRAPPARGPAHRREVARRLARGTS